MINKIKGEWWLLLIIANLVILIWLTMIHRAHGRDDGRYAGSPLKPWFDSLKSGKGPCCSDADGTALSDVDWDTQDGRYRVRLEDQWIVVPDEAVLKQPNLYGRTMVWPIRSFGIVTTIRCFIPGVLG